jgi:uncharacterized protein
MKELVEYIAQSLVDQPDQVRVTVLTDNERLVKYQLTVAPEDIGKVIGMKGRTIAAIRTVVSVAHLKDNKRVSIDIVKPS